MTVRTRVSSGCPLHRPGPAGTPITDEIRITRTEADAIRVPSPVPVLFDPLRPSNARLDVDNSERRAHPLLATIASLVFMACCLATGWVITISWIMAWLGTRSDRSTRPGR